MKTTKRVRGSLLVEAALSMLAFTFILFGSLDYGGAYWWCQALQHSVLDATRYAIVHGATREPANERVNDANKSVLEQMVKDRAFGLDKTDPAFSVTASWFADDGTTLDPEAKVGSTVHVQASYPMELTVMKKYFAGDCGRSMLCQAHGAMVMVR